MSSTGWHVGRLNMSGLLCTRESSKCQSVARYNITASDFAFTEEGVGGRKHGVVKNSHIF